MPRRNGTGPLGMGPMTGRGFGLCSTGNFAYKSRLGCRMGYGRGFGRFRYYPVNQRDERAFLEDEKTILEERIKYIDEVLNSSQDKD